MTLTHQEKGLLVSLLADRYRLCDDNAALYSSKGNTPIVVFYRAESRRAWDLLKKIKGLPTKETLPPRRKKQ